MKDLVALVAADCMAFAFTIPLSGIPALEKRAAEAYGEADRWVLVAAEHDASGDAAVEAVAARETAAFARTLERTLCGTNYVSALDVAVDAGRGEFSLRAMALGRVNEQLVASGAFAERGTDILTMTEAKPSVVFALVPFSDARGIYSDAGCLANAKSDILAAALVVTSGVVFSGQVKRPFGVWRRKNHRSQTQSEWTPQSLRG